MLQTTLIDPAEATQSPESPTVMVAIEDLSVLALLPAMIWNAIEVHPRQMSKTTTKPHSLHQTDKQSMQYKSRGCLSLLQEPLQSLEAHSTRLEQRGVVGEPDGRVGLLGGGKGEGTWSNHRPL